MSMNWRLSERALQKAILRTERIVSALAHILYWQYCGGRRMKTNEGKSKRKTKLRYWKGLWTTQPYWSTVSQEHTCGFRFWLGSYNWHGYFFPCPGYCLHILQPTSSYSTAALYEFDLLAISIRSVNLGKTTARHCSLQNMLCLSRHTMYRPDDGSTRSTWTPKLRWR